MAAPEVSLTEKNRFTVDTVVEAAAGETQVIINLPRAVPAGKKAQIRLRVRAQLIDV